MAETKDPENRDVSGRFVVGHGPTGGGRRRMREDVREMLEAATPKAAQRLIEALDATKAVVVSGENGFIEKVDDFDLRMKAANAIMDRIYGKAPQAIMNEDGSPLFGGGAAFELIAALGNLKK